MSNAGRKKSAGALIPRNRQFGKYCAAAFRRTGLGYLMRDPAVMFKSFKQFKPKRRSRCSPDADAGLANLSAGIPGGYLAAAVPALHW